MSRQLTRSDLIVKTSTIHGLGVFANQDIKQDEIIEECHILLMEQGSPELSNYYFIAKDKNAIALGCGSLFNHSDLPNAAYRYDPEHSLIVFSAMAPIRKGDEVFISYGESWFSSRNLQPKKPSLKYRLRLKIRPIWPLISICFRGSVVIVAGYFFITLLRKGFFFFL